MSYSSLLRQNSTIYSRSGHNAEGRESFGSGTATKCRASKVSKMRVNPKGEPTRIDIIFHFPTDTTISIDDKIVYDSDNYKVINKGEHVDGTGRVRNLRVEAQLWQ